MCHPPCQFDLFPKRREPALGLSCGRRRMLETEKDDDSADSRAPPSGVPSPRGHKISACLRNTLPCPSYQVPDGSPDATNRRNTKLLNTHIMANLVRRRLFVSFVAEIFEASLCSGETRGKQKVAQLSNSESLIPMEDLIPVQCNLYLQSTFLWAFDG